MNSSIQKCTMQVVVLGMADANSDDVRVMKNAMKMAYFNRFSSVLCAL